MSSTIRFQLIFFTILSLAFASAVFSQGPLAPPGSPAPTMKSLNQIDARVATAGERIPVSDATCPGDSSANFVIANPGSYFLAGNVIGAAGKHGVHITAAGVTLDLNGYQLDGASAGNSQTGILIEQDNVIIRNGRVMNWGLRGVDVEGSGATLFERLTVANCGAGFFIFGQARYVSCHADNNQGNGFDGFVGHQYVNCGSSGNQGTGFVLYDGNVAEGCFSITDGAGFAAVGPGAVLRGCTANQYGGIGFNITAPGASLTDCTVMAGGSTGVGFQVGGTGGFMSPPVQMAAVFERCVASIWNRGSSGVGFDASNAIGVTFHACVATRWGGSGFALGPGCTVADCAVSQISFAGIEYADGCTITGNTVFSNDFGIDGQGARSKIEGNTVTQNYTVGINSRDNTLTNVIARNVSRNRDVGTTNYNPNSGPNIGPTGQNPGGVTPATSPWANF